jgi:hypothetical protein
MLYILIGRILCYESDTGSPKKLAQNILKDIEEAGMLPPIIEDTIYIPRYEGDDDNWIGNQNENSPIFILQWEPEDDSESSVTLEDIYMYEQLMEETDE